MLLNLDRKLQRLDLLPNCPNLNADSELPATRQSKATAITGMKPESKLRGITPSALRDCSTYKFQFTSFLKFESHNHSLFLYQGRQCPARYFCYIKSLAIALEGE